MLTDILSRTVSKLSQIIVQILGEKRPFCVFIPFGEAGLGAAYTFISGSLSAHSGLPIRATELFFARCYG